MIVLQEGLNPHVLSATCNQAETLNFRQVFGLNPSSTISLFTEKSAVCNLQSLYSDLTGLGYLNLPFNDV